MGSRSRIALINLRNKKGDTGFDLGIGYIAGALHDNLFPFDLIDEDNWLTLKKKLYSFFSKTGSSKIILLGGMLGNSNYGRLKSLCGVIKKDFPEAILFMGGALATFCAHIVLGNFAVDGLVVGDGHETVIELVEALLNKKDLGKVNGIGYREKGKIVFTARRRHRGHLKLPLPPFKMFNMDSYISELKKKGLSWNIIGTKGCYSKCEYCTRSDKSLRYREPLEVLDEIKILFRNYGINRFNFVDDNFLSSRRYTGKMIQGIKHLGIPLSFRFQGRVDQIDEKILIELKKAHLSGISFGIESGSQTILDEMKKGTTVAQADYALSLCRKYNVPYHASIILGMPSESDRTVEETFQFLKRNHFSDNFRVCLLTLFPGTPLYEKALRNRIIKDEDDYCTNLKKIYDFPYTNLTSHKKKWLINSKQKLESLHSRFK